MCVESTKPCLIGRASASGSELRNCESSVSVAT